MSLLRIPRSLFIRTTNLTHGYQGMDRKLVAFYRAWSKIYDLTVSVDPAYRREMCRMIDKVVTRGDTVLDLGAGTGLGTMRAARLAEQVVAVDLSSDMMQRLRNKARRQGLSNIESVVGRFPEALPAGRWFQVIFSSFAIAHWPEQARGELYHQIFSVLEPDGRIGLFSARGEIASTFETRAEVVTNLRAAGFVDIEVADVADVYRTVTARRPSRDEAPGKVSGGPSTPSRATRPSSSR